MGNPLLRSARSSLVVALVLAGAVITVASGLVAADSATGKIPVRPDAGMTDAQRAQLYESGRNHFDARYQQWLASVDLSKVNYEVLPHVELLGLYAPPQPSLAKAKGHAELIVVAHAVDLKPTAFNGSFVSLTSENVVKGSLGASKTLLIHQGGGLRPLANWTGIEVADAPNEPLILPGHRVLLFLYRSRAGYWEVQGFSGWYSLDGGQARGLSLNPFLTSIQGRSEASTVALVNATQEET